MSETRKHEYVWIFLGAGGWMPSGVFSDYYSAVDWIIKYSLSGYLGKFPVDIGVFDWAIQKEIHVPSEDDRIEIFGMETVPYERYYQGEKGRNSTLRKRDIK